MGGTQDHNRRGTAGSFLQVKKRRLYGPNVRKLTRGCDQKTDILFLRGGYRPLADGGIPQWRLILLPKCLLLADDKTPRQ